MPKQSKKAGSKSKTLPKNKKKSTAAKSNFTLYLNLGLTGLALAVLVAFYIWNKLVPVPVSLQQGTVIGEPYFKDGDTPNGGSGNAVDSIEVNQMENVKYHIHAHLSLFYNGKQIAIPKGIGILPPRNENNGFIAGGTGYYWIHTHDATGIIHIESPVQADYTLGDFFDIWGEPLTRDNIAGFKGEIHIYTDGQQFAGDPRTIVLTPHKEITLEIGSPAVKPPVYKFPDGM